MTREQNEKWKEQQGGEKCEEGVTTRGTWGRIKRK